MKLYPLKLAGIPKTALWGGSRLKTEFGKQSESDTIAESWELSVRDGATNTVENGPAAGQSLSYCVGLWGGAAVSPAYNGEYFPLLVKLIDAASPLSVQVHPDDAYAASHGGQSGKTEMWYVVDAEPGASLVMGLAPGVGRARFSIAVAEEQYDAVLKSVPVKAGDCFFIPSGMVHAIGGGILIAEIQQNCDTTYRVWDYDRIGADGHRRPLHVKEALDVVRPFAAGEVERLAQEGGEPLLPGKTLVCCRYFEVAKWTVGEKMNLPVDRFVHLLVLSGNPIVSGGGETVSCVPGDSVFLPAGLLDLTIAGDGTVLLSCPRGIEKA